MASPAGRIVEFPTARAFAPFLQPARYKGAHGGRGSAKSHEFAKNLLKRCVEKRGTRWVCVREVQKSLEQSVKRLLDDKIAALNLKHQGVLLRHVHYYLVQGLQKNKQLLSRVNMK